MKKLTITLLCLAFAVHAMGQTNAATFPLNWDDGYSILHSNAKVDILVRNAGSAAISSLAYTVEDISSGSVSSEKKLTLTTAIASGEDAYVTFKVPAGSAVGISQKNVAITKVNGETNEASAISASSVGNVRTLSEKMPKRTIEEEYTGTWCGYCPRGTVGMELLSEKYPDTYIGVAFHYDDEFWFSEVGYHDGFPACKLNRHADVDPYNGSTGNQPFGIEVDYTREQNILPLASLDMQATWADDSKTKVNVSSDLKFVYNTEDQFALLYIVTEDGLTGSSQRSYYAGMAEYADDPYMAFWYNGGTSNQYNHVAVAFAGREDGVVSLESPVTVGMEQHHDYCFDLTSALSRIHNKANLHMIVCLLNRTDGTIINTDFGPITTADNTGISTTCADDQTVRYTLDGRRADASQRGVQLVRHTDGTTHKIIR